MHGVARSVAICRTTTHQSPKPPRATRSWRQSPLNINRDLSPTEISKCFWTRRRCCGDFQSHAAHYSLGVRLAKFPASKSADETCFTGHQSRQRYCAFNAKVPNEAHAQQANRRPLAFRMADCARRRVGSDPRSETRPAHGATRRRTPCGHRGRGRLLTDIFLPARAVMG